MRQATSALIFQVALKRISNKTVQLLSLELVQMRKITLGTQGDVYDANNFDVLLVPEMTLFPK